MTSDWGEYYAKKDVSISSILGGLSGHKEIFEAIIKATPKKIIEVGSGSGAMCTFLSWLGYDVLSIDNDKAVLREGKIFSKKWNGSCRYAYADAFSLSKSFAPGEFDIAFSQGFFEHFSDEQIKHLLKEQLAVAKRVVFSVPSYYYRYQDFGNERLMYAQEWRLLLKDFNVVSVLPYSPQLRGIKSLLKDLLKTPWRFLPWRQPVHILVEILP